MQLRHIRPGSVDWYDALTDEQKQEYARLSPEEVLKLRALDVTERPFAGPSPAADKDAEPGN